MSNSIILCEGSTDFVLLQYYMQKVFRWEDSKNSTYHYKSQKSRLLKSGKNSLTIAPSGGCSELPSELEDILEYNKNSTISEFFDKIVIITDNDDSNEQEKILESISARISYTDSSIVKVKNNEWTEFDIQRKFSPLTVKCNILPLIIPFDENGAMETFLLNAISDSNEYDKSIIENTNLFVDDIAKLKNTESSETYLKHRRDRTKAKFDIYFSIRTPAEQFNKRRDILKGVPWEKYALIQTCFCKLSELNS